VTDDAHEAVVLLFEVDNGTGSPCAAPL
jgi:hypothetical protein